MHTRTHASSKPILTLPILTRSLKTLSFSDLSQTHPPPAVGRDDRSPTLPGDGGLKDREAMVIENYVPHLKGMRSEFMLVDAVADLCGCHAYWFGDFVQFALVGQASHMEACCYIIAKLNEQRMGEWLSAYEPAQGGDDARP